MTKHAYEAKPHGSFAAQPERGAYILREPKGEPDVLLLAGPEFLPEIYGAADLLSVQGYTARIAAVENAALFLRQPEAYQTSVLSGTLTARVGLTPAGEAETLAGFAAVWLPSDAKKSEIAAAALAAIRSATR